MFRLGEIAQAAGGVLKGPPKGLNEDAVAKGVSTDTRRLKAGEVFFALRGPNFDGHSFVKNAFASGALAAVVEKAYAEKTPAPPAPDGPLIIVRDPLYALGELASYVRRTFHEVKVVAVSGSTGKTTTKEMIAAILSGSRAVLKTEGNLNNLIGLPLTLLGLEDKHNVAVVELGVSVPGEMKRLCEIASPDVALLTNIGRGHLETLGSIEGVANEKGELFRGLRLRGVKVVNLDDPWIVRLSKEGRRGETVTFSLKEKADVRALDYSVEDGFGGISVDFDVRGEKVKVRLSTPALCNVSNAAAAIATAVTLGVTLEDVQEGLSSGFFTHGRMEVVRTGGITVLDDTYNANPESMAAALETLKRAAGRKVAVLADMLELGDSAALSHRETGKAAAQSGVDIVIAIGAFSKEIAAGALSGGLKSARVLAFGEKGEAMKAISDMVEKGDTVLVKGSRATALEEVVEGLKKEFSGECACG